MEIYKKPLLAILVFVLVQLLGSVVLAVCSMACGIDATSPEVLGMLLVLTGVVTIVIVGWWLKMFRNLHSVFGVDNFRDLHAFLVVVAAICGIVATDLVAEQLDLPNMLEDTMLGLVRTAGGVLAISVIGPTVEELVFREAIMGHMLSRGAKPWTAILFSAFCFGAIHFNPAQVPFAMVVGIILGYIYWKTGNIALTLIIHVLNNYVALVEMVALGESAKDFSYAQLLGGAGNAMAVAALLALLCFVILKYSAPKVLRVLCLMLMLPFAIQAQDLTHHVEADTQKWPVPQVDAEWNLEYLPHNNANHNVYVYKDKLYDALFTRTLGWNGGDGVQTTLLPDGNVFWSFNDSFYGRVSSTTRARGNCTFPRNSIMVQTTGEDGKPGTLSKNQVWLADWISKSQGTCRTHLRHPKGEKTEEQIKAGEIDQQYLYWAGDGTVVDGQLQVLWAGVYNGTENLMQADNRALAIYSLEGTPGDDNYLSLISVDHDFFQKDPIGYGQTLWEDEDGHTYLYACNQFKKNEGDLLNTSSPVVARSTTHDLRSKWEYYVADGSGKFHWQDTYPTAEEVNRSAISSRSVSTAWVFKEGDWYYMTAQGYVFSKQMYIMRSRNAWGPFEECHQLWTMPWVLDKKGTRTYQNFYMPHLHQTLSREGELVFSTNTDTKEWGDNFNATGSADFYRPFFFRVYNWKAVFEE